MKIIYKILKSLALPLFILAGGVLGAIGMVKFWALWAFKDINLFKYLNNDGKGK